jgi:hypothetical protein
MTETELLLALIIGVAIVCLVFVIGAVVLLLRLAGGATGDGGGER